jgi:hypothetical protein
MYVSHISTLLKILFALYTNPLFCANSLPFHFGFLDLRQSAGPLGRVISSSQGLYLYARTQTHTQRLNIHALSGIRTHDLGFRASEDSAST